jgi:hypothetical protein
MVLSPARGLELIIVFHTAVYFNPEIQLVSRNRPQSATDIRFSIDSVCPEYSCPQESTIPLKLEEFDMKKLLALASITSLAILAMPAQAKHSSPKLDRIDRIEQRLENQRYRIREGIDSGELTRKESRRLRKQQRLIKRLTRRFMYDGYLDRYEFSELKHELNRASKRIYRLKHNDRFYTTRYRR